MQLGSIGARRFLSGLRASSSRLSIMSAQLPPAQSIPGSATAGPSRSPSPIRQASARASFGLRSPSPPHKRLKIDDRPSASFLKNPKSTSHQARNAVRPPAAALPSEDIPALAMFTFRGTKGDVKRARKSKKHPLPESYSAEDVLWRDIKDFLGGEYVQKMLDQGDEAEWTPPEDVRKGQELTLRVKSFTVSGDSLSLYEEGERKWVIVTPFAHPGDLIRVTIYKHARLHSLARLEETLEYDETMRGGEGDRRKHPDNGCQYFGTCAGCQLQPIPYELQLVHKKRTVELAYQRYSNLRAEVIPTIRDTIPSPKQWAYRTKITPHFDTVPKSIKKVLTGHKWGVVRQIESEEDVMNAMAQKEQEEPDPEENGMNGEEHSEVKRTPWKLAIGFQSENSPRVLDIEECPIATNVLNVKLTEERKRVQDTIMSYERGATLLLRDSLPPPIPSALSPFDPNTPVLPAENHIAITDHRKPVFERVGDKMFTFTAGSFFQNNNSILPSLAQYVREAIFPPDLAIEAKRPTHLVDAYCGSGFFGICLSDAFDRVAGVEVDPQSITAAKQNAKINGVEAKTTWLCGNAEEIFADLPGSGFEGKNSCVIIDPPRKGCDELFLKQLFAFRPSTIVYVSCNVHTQARDIGWFMHKAEWHEVQYKLESIRGFDLFPQTAHVESVAVLRLIS